MHITGDHFFRKVSFTSYQSYIKSHYIKQKKVYIAFIYDDMVLNLVINTNTNASLIKTKSKLIFNNKPSITVIYTKLNLNFKCREGLNIFKFLLFKYNSKLNILKRLYVFR